MESRARGWRESQMRHTQNRHMGHAIRASFPLVLIPMPHPQSLADPKDMPVRMPHVHLADIPWHIGRWERDVQPGGHALHVDLVHVVNPHRHPDALVSRFVSVWSKRGGVRAPAAAPLAALAKKALAFS